MYFEGKSETNESHVLAFTVVFGGLIGVATALLVWPWLGPKLLDPCPLWTQWGVAAYAVHLTLRMIGNRAIERKREKLEARVVQLEKLSLAIAKTLIA